MERAVVEILRSVVICLMGASVASAGVAVLMLG
jgi:hypothetical protein